MGVKSSCDLIGLPRLTDEVEGLLSARSVYTMASGNKPAAMKFFFYAKVNELTHSYLSEINLVCLSYTSFIRSLLIYIKYVFYCASSGNPLGPPSLPRHCRT